MALAAFCGLFTLQASGLTLGRARGAVLIGRPLNITIPAVPDEGETPCFEADLFYGDTRMGRPTLQWEPGNDGQGQLRIVSRQAVDEPMVTVYLSAGCRNKVTRRYVLLAEQAPDAEPAPRAPAVPNVAMPAAPAAPVERPAPTPRTKPAAATAAAAPKVAAAADPAAAPASAPRAAAPSSRRQRAAEAPAGASGRARLRLEAPEVEPDASLRVDARLQSQPTTDVRSRQQAASLWRALNTSPEEAVREADRLRTLESDVASLKESSRQTAAALALMAEQLEKARRERNQVTLVLLGLGGLLLVAAVVAGAWWFRRRSALAERPWHFGASPAMSDDPSDFAPASMPSARTRVRAGSARTVPRTEPPSETRPGSHGLRLAEAAPRPDAPDAGARPDAPVSSSRPVLPDDSLPPRDTPDTIGRIEEYSAGAFTTSMGGLRTVGVEELIDIEDKAAFFVSIGQHDQAIAVLESHVHDEVETSALPWLDLLELYHTFGRRDEYEHIRQEFNGRFNARIPAFDEFDLATGGLEDYPRAMSRIVSLWPSAKVLEVIEESIFRKPDAPGAEAFSLEAYRELILLYHLAREVVPRPATIIPFRKTDFVSTSIEPLSARPAGDTQAPVADVLPLIPDLQIPQAQPRTPDLQLPELELADLPIPELQIPPPSPHLGIDVDLGEIEEQAHARTVLAPGLEFDLDWEPRPEPPAAQAEPAGDPATEVGKS